MSGEEIDESSKDERVVAITIEQARIDEVRARLRDPELQDDYEETTTQIAAMLSYAAEETTHGLILMNGVDLGRRFHLREGSWSVGRGAACDFRFDDSSLSRDHARIQVDESGVTLFDQGSMNGSYVGDEGVDRRILEDGDLVRFGRVQLKYLCGSNLESAYHDELRRLTISCPMTQTFNRRHFFELLRREFSRARRHSRPLAVLMLDLDRFKSINDVFGHLAGDHALRVSASLFRDCLREEDSLARFGGEEFAVILPDTALEGARKLAERICHKVSEHDLKFRDEEIPITVSIGVSALNDDDGADGMSLISRADRALYNAKHSGRSCVRVEAAEQAS